MSDEKESVLDVLAAATNGNCGPLQMLRAHDRVAELIAADEEFDEAHKGSYDALAKFQEITRELRLYGNGPDSCRQRIASRWENELKQAIVRLADASTRRVVAIAACKG